MSVDSIGKAKYYLTFIDDKTRMTFVYFIKHKNEVFGKFLEFKAYVEKQTGKRIKTLRSDNDGEYVSHKLATYLKTRGIAHQTTVPNTPEQNRVAERANHTINERARNMLNERHLSQEYWAEAVNTAIYLKNRSPQ